MKRGRTEGIVRKDFASAFETLGMVDPGFRPSEEAKRYRGRGGVFAVEIPGHPGARAVIRYYRHGGLSGVLFGGWFFGVSRAFRELVMAHDAFAKGVPTPRPLAAVTFRRFGLFYRAFLVSEESRGTQDLAVLTETVRSDPKGSRKQREAASAAARVVRTMHDAGFYHADLNLKNILVSFDGEKGSAQILDWDLSRSMGRPLTRRERMSNLMRLDRSARKSTALGLSIPLKERLRFLKVYLAPGGIAAPTRGELRRWAFRSWFHRLAWWFSR
ncbi:MAG: lipopolysaccharide kinase InaA family protein [Planctomycetota bacterium]